MVETRSNCHRQGRTEVALQIALVHCDIETFGVFLAAYLPVALQYVIVVLVYMDIMDKTVCHCGSCVYGYHL